MYYNRRLYEKIIKDVSDYVKNDEEENENENENENNKNIIDNNYILNQDNGSSISDCIKSIINYKICNEKLWEYDIDKFNDKPIKNCYKNGYTRPFLEKDGHIQANLASYSNYNYYKIYRRLK